MATIFTRIVNREIPAYVVAEDDRFLAFLDINPLVTGHVLVIPKQEVDYIFDLDDKTLADLNIFAKRVALAVQQVIPCKRVGIAVIGLEVPHVHIHLVPMNSMGDINFSRPKLNPSKEQLQATGERIANAYQQGS